MKRESDRAPMIAITIPRDMPVLPPETTPVAVAPDAGKGGRGGRRAGGRGGGGRAERGGKGGGGSGGEGGGEPGAGTGGSGGSGGLGSGGAGGSGGGGLGMSTAADAWSTVNAREGSASPTAEATEPPSMSAATLTAADAAASAFVLKLPTTVAVALTGVAPARVAFAPARSGERPLTIIKRGPERGCA